MARAFPSRLPFLILLSFGPASSDAGVLYAVTRDSVLAIDTSNGALDGRWPLPASLVGDVGGIQADVNGYLLPDRWSEEMVRVDLDFGTPAVQFATPDVSPEGIARNETTLYLNGQTRSVPPDTLFALDAMGGGVLDRFAMPDSVTGLKDMTWDGTKLWGLESAKRRLWRIDPVSGTFELFHPLASATVFAVAWDETVGELWIVETDVSGVRFVGHVVDRTTGFANQRFVTERNAVEFAFAAAHRDGPTPVIPSSWGAIKARFDGAPGRRD